MQKQTITNSEANSNEEGCALTANTLFHSLFSLPVSFAFTHYTFSRGNVIYLSQYRLASRSVEIYWQKTFDILCDFSLYKHVYEPQPQIPIRFVAITEPPSR